MKIQYDPNFIKKLKKLDVRIRRAFEKQVAVFLKNPFDLQLNNHKLRNPYQGLRSIDITFDYRAFYEETKEANEEIMYFTIIGTHKELYRYNSQEN